MEIPGGTTAGGVGARKHAREVPARDTQAQGTSPGVASAHGTHSGHMGPGTSPNRPRAAHPPQAAPTSHGRSGALLVDLFLCKSTLI